jgi:hypothetical protein
MTNRTRRCRTLLLLSAGLLHAQPPVAPTGEPTQSNRGDDISGYNFRQAFELGYRWNTVGGDTDMYRSTVNYDDGIRLLSGSLSVESRSGHGLLFDQFLLTTLGLGNDPYQAVNLRIEKNRLYRYDLAWRSNAYFNPALTIGNGDHLMNTTRRLQDHDLTLFPQSAIRFFLGYSRDTNSGPSLSTIQLFDYTTAPVYPLFANIRDQQNEYRLGGEARVLGFRVNVLRGWEDFKEDTQQVLTAPSTGIDPSGLNQLNSFLNVQPYHGTSPYWRVGLFREGKKFWAVNGRFSYVAGNRGFIFNQQAAGLNSVGANILQQAETYGNAQRPAATGNFTFSLFPNSITTFTNQTSVYNIRMSGNSYFEQYTNGAPITPILFFNYLGIRTISNSTDLQIRPWRWFSIHAGFTYDDRRIGSVTNAALITNGLPLLTPTTQTNLLFQETLGFRIKAAKSLTISVDGDLGRADKPIYPISEKDYHALRARAEYKLKTLRMTAYAKSDYNTNSASLTSFASHSRQYGADASWVPVDWFSIDADYSRLHLDTLGGIAYFLNAALVTGDEAYYVSNIHTATLSTRFTVRKRADIALGYSHVQDAGDGRSSPLGSGAYTSQPALLAAQTFPLRYLSPSARLSIRITPKLRWNVGYQYYGYREDFSAVQNYRAHTGYSSVSWSF